MSPGTQGQLAGIHVLARFIEWGGEVTLHLVILDYKLQNAPKCKINKVKSASALYTTTKTNKNSTHTHTHTPKEPPKKQTKKPQRPVTNPPSPSIHHQHVYGYSVAREILQSKSTLTNVY